ncbi:MAG: heat-inducible transcriptional repressor HrcA [Candidatus Eisenbacteria bacterium]
MHGAELTDRESTILQSIIEGYVREPKPVSSSAVVRMSSVSLSSATVRNVMRALEKRGLILQPHTSAGRIPTDQGYRYYVDNLIKPARLTASEQEEIGNELTTLVHCDLATVLAGISRMVSEISEEMAIAVAPSGGGQVIEQVSLVTIGAGRVLAVVATDAGPTRTVVLTTDGTFHEVELSNAADILNDWLRGVTLSEASPTIEARLGELDPAPSDWLAGLLDGARVFLAPGGGERIHYEGARYIFRHPEFSSDASSLGEILDSEETLADVVRGPAKAAEVRVVIGGENLRSGMSRMSLVAGTYRMGGSAARMGIIGPTRMRYPRLISLVGYVSKVLDDLLAE